jgi:hypothetical protein
VQPATQPQLARNLMAGPNMAWGTDFGHNVEVAQAGQAGQQAAQQGAPVPNAQGAPPALQAGAAGAATGNMPQQGMDMAQQARKSIWPGAPGNDAASLAMQNPATPEQQQGLIDVLNNGQVPQEQVPRATQQVIAQDTAAKAQRRAQQTGEPIEQAQGAIAQQRMSGQFDEEDEAAGIQNAEKKLAKEELEQAKGAPASKEEVDAAVQEKRKDPSWMQKVGLWWSGLETDEKIGLVVGLIGGAVALTNALSGGSGSTTLIAGALGAGGLAYALGGGDWLKSMWGGEDQKSKAPGQIADDTLKVPGAEEGAAPPTPPAEGGLPTNLLDQEAQVAAGPDAEMEAAAGPTQFPQPVMDALKGDNMIDQAELGTILKNPEMMRGMQDAQLAELFPKFDPKLQRYIGYFAEDPKRIEPFEATWAEKGISREDLDRLIKIHGLTQQPAA